MFRRHYFALAFLPVVFACTSDADSEETDVGTDSDTEEDFDTGVTGPDRRDTDGTCTPQAGTCEVVEVRELLVVDQDFGRDGTVIGPFSETLSTDAEWQTWWQAFGSSDVLPAVDFETETVLIAGYGINATCNTLLQSFDVTDCDGTMRLTSTSRDSSGTCFTTCDAEGGTVVVVAVPSTDTEVCAQVDLSCATARR